MKYKNKTIKKLGNMWYVRYRANGQQYRISDKTQNGCLQKLKLALENMEQTNVRTVRCYSKFSDWYTVWLNTFKVGQVKEGTLKTYATLKKYISEQFKKTLLGNINGIMCQAEINNITSARQQQKFYEFLKDIFQRAVEQKLLKENPLQFIKKPTAEKVHNKRALTVAEERSFVAACAGNKYGTFFLTCLYQGLRRGECLALTPNDINFEEKTLNINKSINDQGHVDTTKTKSGTRTMPLFERTIDLLKTYLTERKVKNNERLFNVSGKPLHINLKRICAAGPIKEITTHELRHTFITRCQDLNVPEHVVQLWVGHEIGSKVTKSVYTHVNADTNLLYINKLNSEFSTHF